MADEDEIDVLGDFSLDSCLQKNNHDIPCSDFLQCDYTETPQWLLDSSTRFSKLNTEVNTITTMQGSKVVTADAETRHGSGITMNISTSSKLQNTETNRLDLKNVEPFHCEEILSDNDIPASIEEVIGMVNTGETTVANRNQLFNNGAKNSKSLLKINYMSLPNNSKSLLKPNVFESVHKSDIFDTGGFQQQVLYEDDFFVGNIESVGDASFDSESDKVKLSLSNHKERSSVNTSRTIGHRKKIIKTRKRLTSTIDKMKSSKLKTKFNISISIDKSQRSILDSKHFNIIKEKRVTPKMQIVTGSGQALSLSEGEQVIKLEKKKDSESESDIDVDVGSDDDAPPSRQGLKAEVQSTKCSSSLLHLDVNRNSKMQDISQVVIKQDRKIEPSRRRQRKLKLDGDGGYTIRHSEHGDVYEVVSEPRQFKLAKKPPVQLIYCKPFSSDYPAPYGVQMSLSALLQMDFHAHGSRAEVMGLLGGREESQSSWLLIQEYRPCRSEASSLVHCDMCPVSQAAAAEWLLSHDLAVLGWHHSHPRFPPQPSAQDLATQYEMQACGGERPFVGVITSQHWAPGRTATQFRCLRVEREESESGSSDTAYQFSVKLYPDINTENVSHFLSKIREIAKEHALDTSKDFMVDLNKDICPDAGITYLEKCISSMRHHLLACDYTEEQLVFKMIIKGVQDVFR